MKINELIKELCPNGVEWKTLGEVCQEIIVPMRDRPKIFDGTIPWCRIEDIEGQYFNKSLSGLGVSESIIKEMNLKVFPTGTVICSCSASIGVYAINTQPLITNQTFIGLVCGENLYNKFLLYFMETQTNTIKGLATIGTIPYVSRQKFESLQIPVPPLAIQTRIVEILDHFTNLTAELTAELNLRRKQFEHYREKLLSLDGVEGVEWKKLGEVAENLSGFPFDSSKFVNNGIKLMRGMNVKRGRFDFNKDDDRYWTDSKGLEKYLLEKNDIIISMDGSLVGKSFGLLSEEFLPLLLVQRVARVRAKKVDSHYVYHIIKMSFADYVDNKKTAGAIPHISMKDINNFPIPIPPLATQHSIVSILDKFTALIENIEKELALRQKQYEYYREELLRFGG